MNSYRDPYSPAHSYRPDGVVGSYRDTHDPAREAGMRDAAAWRHLPLTGRTALVTGAGAGIGQATAAALSTAGASVYGLDRDADRVKTAADEHDFTPVVCDLGADGWRRNVITEPWFGEVDILVNIAGSLRPALLHEADPDDLDTTIGVMLGAAAHLTAAALSGMYARGWGRVLGVSSVYGRIGGDGKGGYVAAKWGLHGLYKQVALEGAARGVTANLVCPGHVDTDLLHRQARDEAAMRGIDPADRLEELRADMPAGRFVEPAEVAAVLTWLAGTAPAMLTGADIPIDGAWTAGRHSGLAGSS